MKKGNAFDALLAADPEQPSPSASPAKPGRANKAAGFRHGVVCGAWHSGQVLFLLHRHGDTKNWALALLTDKVVDEAQGRDQALALLASAVPSLPNVKLIDAPPMKESGTVQSIAICLTEESHARGADLSPPRHTTIRRRYDCRALIST